MAAPLQDSADTPTITDQALAPPAEPAPATEVRVGLRLAAARKAKGLNHVDVHTGTKIKLVHIAAIEAGQSAYLPATPFTAGFVKSYAQFLGLDGEAFAKAYKDEAGFAPELAPVAPAQPVASIALPRRPSSASATAPAPVFNQPAQSFDPEKLVTFIGAGAALAVIAFIAVRAFDGGEAASKVATPAPTVIAAEPPPIETAPSPAPETILPEPDAVVDIVGEPIAQDAVDEPPAAVEVAPPPIKPVRKKIARAAADPAPVEVTPAPILFTTSAEEPSSTPLPAHEALLRAAAAAETEASAVPAAPQPVIEPARVTRGAAPSYPDRCALRAGEKAAVTVIFSVTPQGRPVSASVIASDNRCFNTAAQRAVYDMRFSPRTVDGVPSVETGKTVTVQFVR